jgi:hypothetical protein
VDYESEEVVVLRTGGIDTVTWGADRAGVPIYITSHNGQHDSPYYYWKYTETWAYHARYETAVTLDENLHIVPLTEAIFLCWSTLASTDILVGSSSILDDNTGLINQFPLVIIPWESPRIQYRYSMLIEQHAISKATFDYLEELKKNTENLGTLFDPLPSAPTGNIKCVTYPEENVQGNFTASTVSQKRIFFYPSDLARPEGTRSVTGYEGCFLRETRGDWSHDFPVQVGKGFMGTTKFCIDCRLNGGTTIQPDFWTW